jgi:septum site-determining protein MinD
MTQTKFILFASGKGGTGKTTTAINIGCALTNFAKDVVLVDANLSTPHVGIMLGSPRLKNTLNKALDGSRDIRKSAYVHPSGLKIIPASIAREDFEDNQVQRLKTVLVDLAGTAEIVLLDAPAGFTPEFTHLLRASDELIIVTNPELPAVSDALKLAQLADEHDIPVLGVVLNKQNLLHSLTPQNVEAFLERPLLGMVPLDKSVNSSLLHKQPVVYMHPDSSAAVNFKRIAAKMMGQHYEPEIRKTTKPGFLDKLIDVINRMGQKK